MKSLSIFLLTFMPAIFSEAMEVAQRPKLSHIFDYEPSPEVELEVIFENLGTAFSQLRNDENSFVEFLRKESGELDTGPIKALALHLRNSEPFKQLRTNIHRVIDEVPLQTLKEPEIEAKAAKILVAIIGSQHSLNYLVPIVKKYEDYIEIFSSRETAQNKALCFFCFFVICPVLFESAVELKNQNLIELAAYIQKAGTLKLVQKSQPSGAGQQVINTLEFLNKQFNRSYCFSKDFYVDFYAGLIKLPSKIKLGIIIIEHKEIITWVQNTYALTKPSARGVVNRLVEQKFLVKKTKKCGKSKKYILNSQP